MPEVQSTWAPGYISHDIIKLGLISMPVKTHLFMKRIACLTYEPLGQEAKKRGEIIAVHHLQETNRERFFLRVFSKKSTQLK